MTNITVLGELFSVNVTLGPQYVRRPRIQIKVNETNGFIGIFFQFSHIYFDFELKKNSVELTEPGS